MKTQEVLKKQLVNTLEKGAAHIPLDNVVERIRTKDYGHTVKELPYTLWELLEHIRISQKDILDYIVNPDYAAMEWPKEYWPKENAPKNSANVKKSLNDFHSDVQSIKDLILNPATDLIAPIPHGEKGHTILREVLLIIDHNSYHIGQMVVICRQLGLWASSSSHT